MMRTFLIAMLSVWATAGYQSAPDPTEGPRPDRWRSLILDLSTPEHATKLLGTPVSDKPDRLFIEDINKWFQPGLNKKVVRKMSFKGAAGFDRVDLYFKDDKLVVIQLDPHEKIAPTALSNAYGIEFRPFVGGLAEAFLPEQFERNQGRVYPKTYPDNYSLVGVSPQSIVSAYINNLNAGSFMKQAFGVKDTAGGGFPGKVDHIQLISRKLENRQGADLLK